MSYDLDFWRYKHDAGGNANHQDIYERLSDGQRIDVLEELPIDEIMKRVNEVFSTGGWKKLDDLNWASENGAFQLYTTSQLFRVDCYGMDGNDVNKFIDIASEFDCPLYDPQVGERYSVSS